MKAWDPSVLPEFRERSAHLRESEMPHKPMSGEATEELRRLALFHLWTHSDARNDMGRDIVRQLSLGRRVRRLSLFSAAWQPVDVS